MTPERFAQVERLYLAVLNQPPEARAAYVAARCVNDPELRWEVELLLKQTSSTAVTIEPSPAAAAPDPRGAAEPQTLHASAPVGAFAEGDLVADRFRILRLLGSGGMGDVYEAEDTELGGRVAIKTVRSHVLDDRDTAERFRREILLARQITHPNVCRVHDLFRDRRGGRDVVFLSMELLSGETLRDRVVRSGRLALPDVLHVARHIAEGLGAIHRGQIIHRDLKSANVMLVSAAGPEPHRAVVTDFGLARPAEGTTVAFATSSGRVMGTPAYMAPEQVQGKPLTAAADIYAFGVILYEMVCGRLPFLAENAAATALKRLHEAPPSPRTIVPELPPVWEHVILKCLEIDPAARFATALHAVDALGQSAPLLVSSPVRQTRGAGRDTDVVLDPDSEAARLYLEGLQALEARDGPTARDRLLWVTQLEPGFAPAFIGLADAWLILGDDRRALQYVDEAQVLRSTLSEGLRLELDARRHEAAKEWDRAAAAYAELAARYPGRIEFALKLAAMESSAGRARNALAIVDRLASDTSALDDPRVHLEVSSAAEVLGDAERQRRAAAEAVEKARRRGLRLLEARALVDRAAAGTMLGLYTESRADNERARDLFGAAGDHRGEARALIQLGELERRARRLDLAEAHFVRAVTLTRQVNNARHLARALIGLGNVAFSRGGFDRALDAYEEARTLTAQIGDKHATAVVLGNMAAILYQQARLPGRIEKAKEHDRQALRLRQEIGDRAGEAFTRASLAEMLMDSGELALAGSQYATALRINEEIGDRSEAAYALAGLGTVLLYQARFRDALDAFQRVRVIREEIGDSDGALEAEVRLAQLALEEAASAGRTWHDAETTVAALLARARECRSAIAGVQTRVLWCQVLLGQQRAADADAIASEALEMLASDMNYETQFAVRLGMIRAKTLSDTITAARLVDDLLDGHAVLLQEMRLYRQQVMLAQAERALRQGQRAEAAAILSEVEETSRRLGMELVRRHALQLMDGARPG